MDKDRQHESEIMKYAGSVFRQDIAEAHSPAKAKLSGGDIEAHLGSTDSSHGHIVSHANRDNHYCNMGCVSKSLRLLFDRGSRNKRRIGHYVLRRVVWQALFLQTMFLNSLPVEWGRSLGSEESK
jgi:hypothetical protein